MTRDDPAQFAPPPAFGPFRVLHQIGVGALGPVFRAYEPTRDRLIAVKVFRLDITPEQAQALADALSMAAEAGLFHPSIVEPVAAGVEGTVAYRAEEYVAAESLDVAIRHYAPAPLDKALPFITQLAGAIDFARAAGVGHGALHLRDIFVTPDEARASGFGVVEALERVGLRAPVRRPYSAPERIAGRPWGTPADVFSLAAITYELLTGRRPSGTGEQIGPLTGADVGEYGDRVHAVLARGMAEDPAARYDAALGFASALEAAARGEAVTGAVAQVGAISGATMAPAAAGARGVPDRGTFEDDEVTAAGAELPDEEAIALERDLDDAHYGLTVEEEARRDTGSLETGAAGLLFDEDEAVEDLAMEPPPERFADDDAIEPDAYEPDLRPDPMPRTAPLAAPIDAPVPPPYRGGLLSHDEPSAAAEPPRSSMLPKAVMLMIGLLVGFFAGYTVGGRNATNEVRARVDAGAQAPSEGSTGQATDQAKPGQGGQAWSEQAVAQPPATPSPVTPTPVPSEPPEPAAETPAAPARATLTVQSTPSRANVTVDGKWRGRTPLTLDDLAFGTHSVRVVQDGYEVSQQQVRLTTTQPTRTLSLRLERAAAPAPRPAPAARTPPAPTRATPRSYTGTIYVDSRPRGARVFLDGKQIGTTPMSIPEVPIGSHVVRLELDDHRTWTSSTRVVAGEERRVTGSLERIR